MLSLAFCLAAAAVLRLALVWSLDLRGSFGPDAPGAAAAAFTGPFRHPYPLHPLLIRVFSALVGDPSQGALLLSLTAGMAAVAAAWLLGRVLTAERDGRAMGLVAAASPLLVQVSLLGGGDALAIALAWWGVALGWWGARAQERAPEVDGWARAAVVAGGALWGLSAAAKPIALPAGAFLLLAPLFGDRRSLPWLGAGLGVGVVLALPFLRPLLLPLPDHGLLGSWWNGGVPSPTEWPRWAARGIVTVLRTAWNHPWSQIAPLGAVAVAGGVVAGPRRLARLGLVGVAFAVPLGVAAMLGSRLMPRYLAGASLGWVLLAGMALTPAVFRVPPVRPMGPWRIMLGPLPLSLGIALLAMSSLRFWEGMASLRVQEEGTAPPRGVIGDWPETWAPTEAYQDSSLCGALELERLATDLARDLPRGGTVVSLPLRDGRTWHLFGPLAVARPDLHLVALTAGCCPAGPEACAAALPRALAESGGGVLVVPLLPDGRCATGALADDLEPWQRALRPSIRQEHVWFGTLGQDPVTGTAELCSALGGRAPQAPARP
jgi:hypothetical protein